MADNKVRFGLRNVHVAFRVADVEGEPAWDTPDALPGAISFKPTPEGDEVKVYADDGPYWLATTNNGYTGDVEVTSIPDAILAKMLNYKVDANGALIEDADALPAPFALMFEVQGDAKARRSVYYECTASRPSREEKTKEQTIAPGNDVIKITAVPIEVGGVKTPKVSIEPSLTNATEYNGFFDAVYVPEPVA